MVRVVDTRERRSFLVDVPDGCSHRAVGGGQLLYRPDQTTELCRPLRREQDPTWGGVDDEEPRFFPYESVRPLGLGGPREAEKPGLYVDRCGSTTRRRLTSGLAPRVAYWRVGYRLHVFFLRSGRREVYDFGEGQPALPGGDWRGLLQTVATKTRLYVTLSAPGKHPRTYVIRVPER